MRIARTIRALVWVNGRTNQPCFHITFPWWNQGRSTPVRNPAAEIGLGKKYALFSHLLFFQAFQKCMLRWGSESDRASVTVLLWA